MSAPGLRAVALPPRLLLSLAAVAVAALAFMQFGLGGTERLVAADTIALAERIREDAAALRRRRIAEPAPQPAPAAQDPTALLRQAQTAAARAGARILRLNPRPREDGALELELSAPFPALLRLVAELELLGAVPRGLQLGAPDAGEISSDAGARRAASLVLEPPRRGAVSGPAGDSMLAAAGGSRLRDPFAPLPAARPRDLSSRHRLTGLTVTAGGGLATIDGADYEKGDLLGDMTVVSIDEDGVLLASGEDRFRIRFREPAR